jgi:hypothetical protein
MERRISISALKKKKRYLELKSALMVKGWTVYDLTFEIGALGFVSTSIRSFLSKLGFSPDQMKYMIQRMCLIARRSSFYIWNARHSLTWNPPVICPANALPKPKIATVSPPAVESVSPATVSTASAVSSASTSTSASVSEAAASLDAAATPFAAAAATVATTLSPLPIPRKVSRRNRFCPPKGPHQIQNDPRLYWSTNTLLSNFFGRSSRTRPKRHSQVLPKDIAQPRSGCLSRGGYVNPVFNSFAHLFKAWKAPLPPHDYVGGEPFGAIRSRAWRRKGFGETPGVFPDFVTRV